MTISEPDARSSPSMGPLPTSLAVVFRRMISAVMCALMVMSVVASIDVPANAASFTVIEAGIEVPRGIGDDQQDGSPCHAPHHLCGKVMPLPPALAGDIPGAAQPSLPHEGGPSRVLLSSIADQPVEPPRT